MDGPAARSCGLQPAHVAWRFGDDRREAAPKTGRSLRYAWADLAERSACQPLLFPGSVVQQVVSGGVPACLNLSPDRRNVGLRVQLFKSCAEDLRAEIQGIGIFLPSPTSAPAGVTAAVIDRMVIDLLNEIAAIYDELAAGQDSRLTDRA